jgi:hypothetical protein
LLKQVKRNEVLNEEKTKQREIFEKFEKNLKEKLMIV